MRREPSGGAALRTGRLVGPDRRSVIVALDHGLTGVPQLGALRAPADFLASVAAAGADAVLVTPGTARAFAGSFGRLGVIVRLDGGPTSFTGRWAEMRPLVNVEDALRLGADGVAIMGMVGTSNEADSLGHLARAAADAERWGVPLLAEMLPHGLDVPDVDVEQVATAARIGAELGASLVKVPFRGDAHSFRSVTDGCFAPVVVLGGGAGGDVAARLGQAMLAGAAGVAVGRDVWLARDPAAATRRLVEVVHGGRATPSFPAGEGAGEGAGNGVATQVGDRR